MKPTDLILRIIEFREILSIRFFLKLKNIKKRYLLLSMYLLLLYSAFVHRFTKTRSPTALFTCVAIFVTCDDRIWFYSYHKISYLIISRNVAARVEIGNMAEVGDVL